MAATDVIWFLFCTQAARGGRLPLVLKPYFLFEHSPPILVARSIVVAI
jgi:hypothetical protein